MSTKLSSSFPMPVSGFAFHNCSIRFKASLCSAALEIWHAVKISLTPIHRSELFWEKSLYLPRQKYYRTLTPRKHLSLENFLWLLFNVSQNHASTGDGVVLMKRDHTERMWLKTRSLKTRYFVSYSNTVHWPTVYSKWARYVLSIIIYRYTFVDVQ